MTTPAKLDSTLIDVFVASFPNGEGWEKLPCSQIGELTKRDNYSWKNIAHLKGKGGVYAFYLPASFFASVRTIHLHGPKKSKIPFEFSLKSEPGSDIVIVYIGRTSNLCQRFAAHLRKGKRQASAQVK